ncbi:unnamed protein product [Nippostrongylus brasiliensis]|uniref:DUF222 domain-containing protein n=1 Tax=Nippostrongylus brasiliensis TaxID=27835 RepID=A0A0N4Y8Y8_NIPBR|nr:unnamed protein product [Nippostrongylus brasiliensis]
MRSSGNTRPSRLQPQRWIAEIRDDEHCRPRRCRVFYTQHTALHDGTALDDNARRCVVEYAGALRESMLTWDVAQALLFNMDRIG